MPGKRVSKDIIQLVYFNYYKGKSAKEIADMFSLKIRTVYNIISRAEKEGRLDLKGSTGRPKKVTQRVERKIIRTVYDNPQSSTRGLALQMEKDFGLRVSHETIRNVLQKHKYSSRVARKKPLLSAQNVEKRLRFATEYISLPLEYWDDVIFSDETKIMLYYHDGPQRVWRKPLTALENKNLIPTVKFGKLSVMVWGCISSKGVGVIRILDEIMTKEVYLDILKNELTASIKKFGFIDPVNPNKLNYKYYQDNDPKHKSYLCKSWLLYNCTKVIDTPAQSPDINPIENLWVHLKKKVGKRSPTNKNELIRFIKEEWEKIPLEYDIPKLIQSMRRRLQAVIDAQGGHTKY